MEIEVVENVMQYNKEEAYRNRQLIKKSGVLMINILSAPGAGKTSLILATIKAFKSSFKIGVIEWDISSTHDAEKIKDLIDDVVQINTGGTCHLNASMVARALEKIDISGLDLLFVENVGNLICPVGFDLGEDYRIILSSVSEGDDKPVKYPKAFIRTDLVLLNKIDLISFSDFKYDFFEKRIRDINPEVEIFKISCKTKEGFNRWLQWVEEKIS